MEWRSHLAIIKTKGIHSDDHDNEEVLRIIFPDENLKFPRDVGCDLIYRKQIWDKAWMESL